MKSVGLTALLVAFSSVLAVANDWPGWRGPDRTDIGNETGLLKSWPEGGPPRTWLSEDGGLGYAGFAIVGDRLFTMGLIDDTEFVICLNASSGEHLWQTPVSEKYENAWGDGPRSTPTIDGDFVYALSGRGSIACLRASDGEEVWVREMQEFGGQIPRWGYCESLLVDGDQVVCTPGGSDGALVSLAKQSGELTWQSTEFQDPAEYSSIIKIDHFDQEQYIQLTQKSIVGINPSSGALLWQVEWPGAIAVIPTPIYHDGMVYITSGYGVGCVQFRLTEDNQTEEIFRNRVMKNHHGGVILVDGHYYGFSDDSGWTCQNAETGERVWNNRDDLGKGAIGYADGCFYCLDEGTGEVALIEASPDGWNELGRFTLDPQTELRKDRGRIWVHPVILNGRLYLRDQELIYCYDVSGG